MTVVALREADSTRCDSALKGMALLFLRRRDRFEGVSDTLHRAAHMHRVRVLALKMRPDRIHHLDGVSIALLELRVASLLSCRPR
jgi:hypothetical protein